MSETTHPSVHPGPAAPTPRPPTPPRANPGSDALNGLQLDIARLIDAYEIDVTCHSCRSVHPRSIGWLRLQPAMDCPHCQASIVLRTSVMNDEMRRVARQLRELEQQLAKMIQHAVGILGQ
jgi:hypothetical protein